MNDLYSLPKDILVKLIFTISNEYEKRLQKIEDQLDELNKLNKVVVEKCSESNCEEYCVHPKDCFDNCHIYQCNMCQKDFCEKHIKYSCYSTDYRCQECFTD